MDLSLDEHIVKMNTRVADEKLFGPYVMTTAGKYIMYFFYLFIR